MTIYIVLGILGLLGFFAVAKSKGLFKKSSTSKNTSWWIIGPIANDENKSKGMPAKPTRQGKWWMFNFPDAKGSVHGVPWFDWSDSISLAGKTKIIMRFAVTGGGILASDGSGPGRVCLQFQRKGDDWSNDGKYVQYRWFSRTRPVLKAGELTLTVPLDLTGLHDTDGKSEDAAGLKACLKDLDNISVSFGGKFAAHGVYATEPSTFTLLDLYAE